MVPFPTLAPPPGEAPSQAQVSALQPATLRTPEPLQLGSSRQEDLMGIPLAGGALLLVLMVAAVAIRLRTARGSLAATTGQQPRRVSLQRLLGAGQSTGPVGEGIVIESQAQLDSSTRLHAIRWAGGRLLLATHTQFAPTLLDRAEGQPPQREEAP